MSAIPPLTIAAYLETDYYVYSETPFVLRVGVASEALAKLYKRLKLSSGAFVTAFNPHSKLVGEAVNTSMQSELTKELNRRSLAFFDGTGKHPSGRWPEEPSYFILGLSYEAAKALGKKYGQNALIWCGADAKPELILLS